MTIDEELRTCYANLRGHQDRSIEYIRQIDRLTKEIFELESRLRKYESTNPVQNLPSPS